MDARQVTVTAEIHLQRIHPAPSQRRAQLANLLTKWLHNTTSAKRYAGSSACIK